MSSDSKIFGVSVRAIIVLILVFVFTVTVFKGIDNQALNGLLMSVVGWYYGQKSQSPTPPLDKK